MAPDLCPSIMAERLLKVLLAGLLTVPGLVPPGIVIDAGANDGLDACHLARAAPSRVVWAIEPLASNVEHIRRRYAARLPNLRVDQGGLGNASGIVRLPQQQVDINTSTTRAGRHANQVLHATGLGPQVKLANVLQHGIRRFPKSSPAVTLTRGRRLRAEAAPPADVTVDSFPIFTVDELLARRGERLALAHWDVEGSELLVLQGAARALRRDRPFFTVEVFPSKAPQLTVRVLQAAQALHYSLWVVQESCGLPLDCRNVLAVPQRRVAAFTASVLHRLGAATAGKLLMPVDFPLDRASVGRLAYPCCDRPHGNCSFNNGGCYDWLRLRRWFNALPAAEQSAWVPPPSRALWGEWTGSLGGMHIPQSRARSTGAAMRNDKVAIGGRELEFGKSLGELKRVMNE